MSSPLLINDEETNKDTPISDNDIEEGAIEKCSFEDSNPYLMQWLTSKQTVNKFRFKGYVEYNKDANASKCLVKSCDRLLSCQNACNIKRHYRRIHNFVILHGKLNPFPEGERDSTNLDKYFSYDYATNKSRCKIPGCSKTFEGKDSRNMLHFRLGHSYKTDHHDWVSLCMLKFDRSKLPVNELVTYDNRTSTYRCLFMNCDYSLEKNFFSIEKHYYDLHLIIFSKYTGSAARSEYQFDNQSVEILDQHSVNANKQATSNDYLMSDDERSTNESHNNQPAATLKVQKNKRKFFASNYVQYCKKTNVSKCLIQNCAKVLKGLSPYNIQRHYQLLHNMFVLSFSKEFNSFDAQNYTLKGKLTNFVSYNVAAASYQCLFMNCNDNLDKDIDVIKSHYYEKHEIVLNRKISKIKEYGGQSSQDENGPHCSKTLIKDLKSGGDILSLKHFGNLISTNYVDFCKKENISKCLMRNCPALNEELEDEQAIKSHYRNVHKIHIGQNLLLKEHVSPSEYGDTDRLKNEDFVFFDKETSSYKCLFINCNQVLENCLPNIKKHYHETHMAIIGKSSESRRRKRKKHRYESGRESSENESFAVTNEVLSEDETTFELEKAQGYSTELCTIKQECLNESADVSIYTLNNHIRGEYRSRSLNCSYDKETPKTIIDTTLTKQSFLKSCFGLIIQHDIPFHLFDDNVFFKHLLSPYEKIINFHINSNLLMDIILKANNTIVDDLKRTFCNNIVSLELFVVSQQGKYFLAVNVRLVYEQSVQNYLIGCMPLHKAGAEVLPIFEYLLKFGIDKQQVYMTTILSDFGIDDKIGEILNNICQHNSYIKKHPLCDLKILCKCFVEKHSETIKAWKKLINNSDCEVNAEVFVNLNDIQRQIQNLCEMEIDIKPDVIKETNLFLKTIKIVKNFLEKLNEEQYVAGDLYRDLLCCELELKSEHKKNSNTYASKLIDDLLVFKNDLMKSDELLAALYLDARFNYLGSVLLTDEQKTKGKLFLCSLWERFSKTIRLTISQQDPLENNENLKKNSNDDDDDEYALLNQHINDTMTAKSNVLIEELITNCVHAKREPFSLDILKYWHNKRLDMNVNGLTKIAFTFPSSQHILIYLKKNFAVSVHDDKVDKFLLRHNQNFFDKNLDLLLLDIK